MNLRSKTAKDFIVVYESSRNIDFFSVHGYLRRNIPVYIIEPFHAYHHNKTNVRFYPPHLPMYIQRLLQAGKVHLIKADELDARKIYFRAADKAVEVIEAVYPLYRTEHERLFTYVAETLRSPIAENVFKSNLCNSLAEFYSANSLFEHIQKRCASGNIMVYPDTNVHSYNRIKKLLRKSRQYYHEHPHIYFPPRVYGAGFLENSKQSIALRGRLFLQAIASAFSGRSPLSDNAKKKFFTFGVSIVSPRQLNSTYRGPDLLIDNSRISEKDVVYFPQIPLNEERKKRVDNLPGEVLYLPRPGRFLSNFQEWKRLLALSFKQRFLSSHDELRAAMITFFSYFRWKRVLRSVTIKHFITHCDFGTAHVGRNIALREAGVQTWYFTDSMNHVCNFQSNGASLRHPFWAYLSYDHLVTWNNFLSEYYKTHPGTFKETHVVGCLWSGHIREENKIRDYETIVDNSKVKDKFVVSVFDSTYSRNGFTSYEEGVTFAKHILRLADQYPDIYIFLKEKKERSIHRILDPTNGPKLLDLYNRMDTHPRITIYMNQVDASDMISISDMVVSFPFTSTTFEALSLNRPAVWHDPMGYYKDTPYGKVRGVTTHSYEELKATVEEIKTMQPGNYKNPVPLNSPLLDPFRDGKAIERFKDLLVVKK